ncbi:hypothetical protein ACHAXR_006525, partial [Thalassiosira sp. AJA248-18]
RLGYSMESTESKMREGRSTKPSPGMGSKHGSARMGELKALQTELSTLIRNRDSLNDNDVVKFFDDDDGEVELGNTRMLMSMKSSRIAVDLLQPWPSSTPPANAKSKFSAIGDVAEGNEDAEEEAPETEQEVDVSVRTTSSVSRVTFSSRFTKMKEGVLGHVVILRRRNVTFSILEKKEERHESGLLPKRKWWQGFFFFSVIAFLACIITLWAPYPIGARSPSDQVAEMPWSSGCKNGLSSCICPRETICADDTISMIFLTIARCSAWFDYPLYMVLFLSKADNLNTFMQRTSLRVWMNFSDYHHVHRLFGIIVGFETASHTFFHLLRWGRRGDDIQLLWTNRTGITGLIAFILGILVIVPMSVPFVKDKMKFEWRKGLHYLFIVWALCLMFHAPQRIFWLIGVPLFIYLADSLVEMFSNTYLIESAYFERLSDASCLLTFENPEGFSKLNAAYVYVMLPWISKSQNHAFTMFPGREPNTSQVCISSVGRDGEWTAMLMKKISIPAHLPAYITGPYLSPFSSPAMDCENLIAIGSGIGITPAISLFRQYVSTQRRVNLIWMCKDAGLVEHFVGNTLNYFGGFGYILIYYTGKRSIVLEDDLPANVLIFNGRPKLEKTISGIIYSISSGELLPEEIAANANVISHAPAANIRTKLLIEKALSIYSMDQLFQHAVEGSGHDNPRLSSYERNSRLSSYERNSRFSGNERNIRLSEARHRFSSNERNSRFSGNERNTRISEARHSCYGRNDDEPASYEGVQYVMKNLLGNDFDLIKDKILSLLETIDSEGSGEISESQFDRFLYELKEGDKEAPGVNQITNSTAQVEMTQIMFDRNTVSHSFMEQENGISDEGIDVTVKRHLNGEGKFGAKNWSMLYCGGSKPILSQLEDYKRKFGIGLAVEKFDW